MTRPSSWPIHEYTSFCPYRTATRTYCRSLLSTQERRTSERSPLQRIRPHGLPLQPRRSAPSKRCRGHREAVSVQHQDSIQKRGWLQSKGRCTFLLLKQIFEPGYHEDTRARLRVQGQQGRGLRIFEPRMDCGIHLEIHTSGGSRLQRKRWRERRLQGSKSDRRKRTQGVS